MQKKTIKIVNILIIIVTILIFTGCQGSITILPQDHSIIYNGSRYYKVDEDFEYYVDYQEPEIGYIRNIIFPRTYLYIAKQNDNLIYSVYGTGLARYLFGDVWVKEGYSFPNQDTIITEVYLTSEFNDVKHILEISDCSFNNLFIEVANVPDNKWIIDVEEMSCLCLLYEDAQLEQTITKGIRWLYEDEYGNIYFSKTVDDGVKWYMFNDELMYLAHKCLIK